MALGDLNITMATRGGQTDTLALSDFARVALIPSTPDTPLSEVTVAGDAASAAPDVTIEFVEGCVPEWPVYVRWANRLGGYEYYMFKGRKTYTEETDRGESYYLASGSGLGATATRGQQPGEVSRVLACGAEGLPFDEWKLLKGVALSPLVQLWDTERQEFVSVTLSGTSIEWDSGNAQGSVDLEFELIDEDWRV